MVYTYKLLLFWGGAVQSQEHNRYLYHSLFSFLIKQSIQIVLLVCFSYRRKRIYLIMHSSHRAVAGWVGLGCSVLWLLGSGNPQLC